MKKSKHANVDILKDDLSTIKDFQLELDALKEVIKNMVSTENIHLKTDLQTHTIPKMSAMMTISEKYGLHSVHKLLTTHMECLLSNKRRSREELIKTVQAGTQPQIGEGLSMYDRTKDRLGFNNG